jgi:UV DNA damage endonuclease
LILEIYYNFDQKDCAVTMSSKLRLGLCCINSVLRNQKPEIFCSRTCTRAKFTVELAMSRALQNIKDIIKLIEWNEIHNIKCLRLSSDIFPHFTDSETPKYTIDFARPLLKEVGDLANRLGHRIVMHPGQFNQVGAEKDSVYQKTCEELLHHATVLDAMGIDDNGILTIHGGGIYKSREATKLRWISQFQTLPDPVKRRLVLENCERSYSTEHCLEISQECGIPVIFDFHHYHCWSLVYGPNSQKPISELLPLVVKTWGARHVLMHISEQAPDKRLGAHSDYIEKLPEELLDLVFTQGVSVDLEIEAKMKEQAILRLYNKYPEIFQFSDLKTLQLNSSKIKFAPKIKLALKTKILIGLKINTFNDKC